MTKRISAQILVLLICVSSIAFAARTAGATNLMVSTWNWGGSDIYQVDSTTGAATLIGSAGVNLHGLTYVGDTLYGFGDEAASVDDFIFDGNIYTIDEATGSATKVFSSSFGSEGAIAFNPADGHAYVVGGGLVQWDLTTGTATRLGSLPNIDISGLAYIGETLYGVGNIFDSLYTIDTSTVTATEVGPLGVDIGFSEVLFGGSSVAGLTYDGTQLLMVTRAGETSTSLGGGVYTVDPVTGSATLNALFSSELLNKDIGGVAAKTQVIPVPPAVWLFGTGLIGLIGFARRKKS